MAETTQTTPRENNQQPEKKDQPPYLEKSEAMGKLIGVPENELNASWKKYLQLVHEGVRDSAQSTLPQVEKEVLGRRQAALESRRIEIATLLNGVERFHLTGGLEMPEPRKFMVLWAIARLAQDVDVYNQMLDGKALPVNVRLPEYLADKVSTLENDELGLKALEIMLPFQYDVLDKFDFAKNNQMTPGKMTPYTETLALFVVRRKTGMEKILECMDGDEPAQDDARYLKFLQEAGFPQPEEKDYQSAKLLVGYLAKNITTIRTYAKTSGTGKLEDLTVGDALSCCTHFAAAGHIAQEWVIRGAEIYEQGSIPDIRKFANEIAEKTSSYSEQLVQVVLAPLVDLENKAEKDRFSKTAQNLSKFFLTGTNSDKVPVGKYEESGVLETLLPHEQEMVKKILAETCTRNTVDALLASAMIPSDPSARSSADKQVAEKLEQLLVRDKSISLREAFQIYYALKTTGPGLPLAFKAIQLLSKYDPDSGIAENLQMRMFRKWVDAAMTNVDDLPKMFDTLALEDPQKKEMSNVARYLEDKGFGGMGKFWNKVYANFVNFWEFYAVLGAVLYGPKAAMLLYKGSIRLRMDTAAKFASMTPDEMQKTFGSDPATLERAKAAQGHAKELLYEFDRIKLRYWPFKKVFWFPKTRGAAIRAEVMAIRNAAYDGDLKALAKSLKSRLNSPKALAEQIIDLAESPDAMYEAMAAAGYSEQETTTAIDQIRAEQEQLQARRATNLGVVDLQALKTAPNGARTAVEGLFKQGKTEQEITAMMKDAGFDGRTIMREINRYKAQQRAAKVSGAPTVNPSTASSAATDLNVDISNGQKPNTDPNTDPNTNGPKIKKK